MRELLLDLLGLWNRATAVLRRRRIRREVDEELDFHLAMRQASEQEAGLDPASAGRAARRRFGNRTAIAEVTREMWTFPSFESVVQDVQFTLRALRKAAGFTSVAVCTLAVGIGANTAIFSLVDAVLFRGLPYPASERLVVLIGNVQREIVERRGGSYPDYLDWRAEATRVDGMAAYVNTSTTLRDADPERLSIEAVSAAYFEVLGVTPALGRGFLPEEDQVADRNPVTVLSHGLWQRKFGGDLSVIGRHIRLGRTSYEVVGVMPAGFTGVSDQATLWVPFTMSGFDLESRGSRYLQAIARLAPGVTVAEAQTEFDMISRRLEQAHPRTNEKRGVEVSPLSEETLGPVRPALLALMAAVGCVLLMACANVAGLLVSRAEARQQEIAVRTALGAGRRRLVRQLITESLVLTALGGLAGVAVAYAAVRLLLTYSPITLPSYVQPGLDGSVLLFTAAVALGCGLLLGVAPALHAAPHRVGLALKSATRGSSGTSRLRGALVVTEVVLAVVLVVAAGLMIRTVRNLTAVDPGFDPSSLLTLNVGTPRGDAAADMPEAPPAPFVVSWRELLEHLEAVPGVASVSLVSDRPLQGGGSAVFYSAEGDATANAEARPRAYIHFITPGFFDTMGIPLLHGRTFDTSELHAESTAVIVSERLARRFWPGVDPIGRRIKLGGLTSTNPWLAIVGVVPELKYRALPDNPTQDPDLYFPYADRPVHAVMVRTHVDPASAATDIRSAVRALSDQAVVYNIEPMANLVDVWTARSRFTSWLMAIFAVSALLLAVVGIYGVMSYLAAQRTREFGIRLALGARPAGIVRVVMWQAAPRIALGLGLGTAAAFGVARWIETLLFGVSATSLSALIPILALGGVALLACVVPAIRASRVSPVEALRAE